VAEIGAVVALLVALGALWLASHANKHVDSSFEEYGKHLAKQVRESQVAFEQKADQVQLDLNRLQREVEALQARERETAEKLNTLTQRLKVVEHDLRNTAESIPPQFRQRRSGSPG